MLFAFPETINELEFYKETLTLEYYHLKNRKKMEKFFNEASELLKIKHRQVFDWIYIRSRLSEAQNHRCCYCKILTTEKRGQKNSSTVEHYKCRVHGGTDDIDNLVMACYKCNNQRGEHTIEDFLEYKINGKKLPSLKKQITPEIQSLRLGKKKVAKLYFHKDLVWC